MAGDVLKYRGVVTQSMGNAMFRVKLDIGEIICTISGNIRKNNIRILDGDIVSVEVSPYDVSRGRITYRHK